MNSTYVVYQHISPGGKKYIGITGRPVAKRWHGGSAYRNNPHFYAAIQKYGWDSFAHEILAEGLTKEAACEMEIRLIAEANSRDPAFGYNRSPGGDKTTLGYHYSEEAKQRISEAVKGKRKGVPFTVEHKLHLSQAQKGRVCSEATRQKLREAVGDRFNTEEARRKQKENTPKGANHHKATAVRCIETGKIYLTITDAAKEVGCSYTNIAHACRGHQERAKGLHWEFVQKGDGHE